MSMITELQIVTAVYQIMAVTGETKAQAFNTLKTDLKTVTRILTAADNVQRSPGEITNAQAAAEALIDTQLP